MRYLQLVHNTWDPVARVTKAKVLHSFGRDFNVPSDRTQHRYQWLDNYSHTIGRHHLKVGGDFNRISFDTKTAVFLGGAMGFSQLPVAPSSLLGSAVTTQLVTLLSAPASRG